MIKKFNEYESINEKWGMEYIIPVLISMGIVTHGQAQDLTQTEVEQIVNQNPDVNTILENKKTIEDSLSKINEVEKVLTFLNKLDNHSQENIRKQLEFTNMDPTLQQKILGFFNGSGVYQVPKLGSFVEAWGNIGKGTSVGFGETPFGKRLGIKKTINW